MLTTCIHINNNKFSWISRLFIAIALIFETISITGQDLSFDHIGPKDGFPSSTALSLLQDQQGFLWIGTTDGLFRYDGNNFREFRSVPNDSSSLSNNYIINLHQDKKGKIWIGTRMGLNCYDPAFEEFSRFIQPSEIHFEGVNSILSVTEDKNGFIWFGTYYGLYRLNVKRKETLQFLPELENPNSINHEIVWQVFESKEGELWIGTNNGLCHYKNDNTFEFRQFLPDPQDPNGLKTGKVWDFVQQPNGTIWLGSDNGFYKVINQNDLVTFQRYHSDIQNPNSLSYDFIENLIADGNERLWACTWSGGLNEIIIDDNEPIKYIHHRHDPQKEYSIRIDQVKDFLKDTNGNIWVANASGLEKHSPNAKKFSTIIANELDPNSISDVIIKAILKDFDGNYWIGTRNGLNYLTAGNFEKKNFDFIKFHNDNKNTKSLSHNNIFGLYQDSQGVLWVSTYSGLNYVDIKGLPINNNLQFKRLYAEDGLPHDYMFNVYEKKINEYWLISYGGLGKMNFDPLKKEYPEIYIFEMDDKREDALVNSSLRICEKDRFGDYWFGTFNGVSKYVNNNGIEYFENYLHDFNDSSSLSDNSINDMLLDKKGRFWIATRKGLNLVVQEEADKIASFKNYGINEGFANDVIQSIEDDNNGILWLGTNRGLVQFNPDADNINAPYVINNFYTTDGLISNAQIFRASYADDQGNLFFGSPGGINYFKGSELTINNSIPTIVFTDLKVLNKSVKINEGKKPVLKKSISKAREITLNHKQNIWTIEFSVLDFSVPAKNKYKYILEGFNENWIDSGNENYATYTNLNAGEYIFKVKGANGDGVWNENPATLIVNILPPPWQTWWAYSFYALIVCGVLYAFIKFRINRKINKIEELAKIEKARFDERELLRKQNAADFHDELGHRLTKISLFLELAERQLDNGNNMSEYLSKIKTQASGLSSGIRDLIWTLDPKSDTLFQTLIRTREFGDKLFEHSNIKFTAEGINSDLDEIQLAPTIRKQLLMIAKEAMNNCLKYSNANNCYLKVSCKRNEIDFSIIDDGIGFDPHKNSTGYGIKNIKNRAEKINAEIKINSEIKEGTSILLRIKLPHMG